MFRNSALFSGAIVALLCSSCHKDCSDPMPSSDRIRFDQPAIGQTSRYLGLLGEDYFTADFDHYSYTDDTLVLEIVAKDNNGFKVRETLRSVGDVDPWMAGEQDSVYYYYFRVADDTLKVTPVGSADYIRSRIFTYGAGTKGLGLKDIDNQQVEIKGWKTDLDYCECDREAYTLNYEQFGVSYDRLNVVVNNFFMAIDGPGETYVYSQKSGIVRFSQYGWWTQSGYGWDLLK